MAREVYGRHEGVWPEHGEDGDAENGILPLTDTDTDSEGSDGACPCLHRARYIAWGAMGQMRHTRAWR